MTMHKRSIPNRSFRVADQIQRDLAELIRELKDPRIGMVTITGVDVTPDYAHATVRFSLLVGDTTECETALNEAAGFVRNGLFKRLSIHTVPTLHFQFDRTTERAAELNALINTATPGRVTQACWPDSRAVRPSWTGSPSARIRVAPSALPSSA